MDIIYDEIGNPINWIDDKVFTWNGRQLVSVSDWDGTTTFTYNVDGIRTKQVWDDDAGTTEVREYILDENNRLLGEQYTLTLCTGEITEYSIFYYYDESGSPVYCQCDGVTYYYVKNQQGDITALITADGTMAVAYEYDAWGNIVGRRTGGRQYRNISLMKHRGRFCVFEK